MLNILKNSALFFFFVVSLSVYSQNKIYLDDIECFVKEKDATQYSIATKESENSIRVDFYTLDDVLKRRQYYSEYDKKNRIKNGVETHYYPDGSDSLTSVYINNEQVGQSIGHYPSGEKRIVYGFKNGAPNGLLLQYYPDGKLRRKELYEEGKCVGGQLFDESGNELPFESYYVQPEIPGGVEALMKFLAENIKYPIHAIREGKQGRVLVGFIVEKDGSLSNLTVIEPFYSLLDSEALRVVKELGKSHKWTPGTVDGKPQRVKFILPVVFRLGPTYSY